MHSKRLFKITGPRSCISLSECKAIVGISRRYESELYSLPLQFGNFPRILRKQFSFKIRDLLIGHSDVIAGVFRIYSVERIAQRKKLLNQPLGTRAK